MYGLSALVLGGLSSGGVVRGYSRRRVRGSSSGCAARVVVGVVSMPARIKPQPSPGWEIFPNQGYGATRVLAGIDEWSKCIIGIAARRICEFLQLG